MEHFRHRLRDLLLLLIESVAGEGDRPRSRPVDPATLLADSGLTEADLRDLVAWLGEPGSLEEWPEEAWLTARRYGAASHGALRQMGQREDELLTVGAFGYLLRLVRTGQITADQMESLIQFAQLAPGGPLTPGELAPLLDRVVFSGRPGDGVAGHERSH